MAGRWGEAPFAALTACLAAGIVVSGFLTHYCFAALALSACAMIAAAAAALACNRPNLSLGCALSVIGIAGLMLGLAERDAFPSSDVRALLARDSLPLDKPVLLDAGVLEDGTEQGADTVTTLQLHGLRIRDAWINLSGTVQLRVAIPDDTQPKALLHYGDRVRIWAECTNPRNFRNPGSTDRVGLLARRGIHLLAHVKSPRLIEVLPQDFGTAWRRAVAAVRRSLQAKLQMLRQEGKPQQAAVLSSIVLGNYIDLSNETRSEFQNAGTYHVLVVSGLHVSTIAWIVVALLQFSRVPVTAARLIAAAGILFFTSIVGFQASITRALWMFTLYLAGQALFRRADAANVVMACAFLLLAVHPAWLLDAGFQLSFLSVTAIVLMGVPLIETWLRPLTDPLRHAGNPERLFLQPGKFHFLGRRLRFRAEMLVEACADSSLSWLARPLLAALRATAWIGFTAASMMLVSFSVQIWIEPLLAFYFNRLSWVAPVANLAVVPLSSVVLAAGIAAQALTAMISMAWPIFRIAGYSASLLLVVNRWFSVLPGAWQRCPTPSALSVAAGLLLLFLWWLLRWRRPWIPCAFVVAEIVGLSCCGMRALPQSVNSLVRKSFGSAPAGDPRILRLSFLDVGQGDSIVIQFPNAGVWVIDAGGLRVDASKPEDTSLFDIGEAVVSRFLWSRWIVALDRAVLTHPHQDHAGGMPALFGNFRIGRLNYGNAGDEPVQKRVLDAARAAKVPIEATAAGDECRIGGVAVRILNPARDQTARSLNDISVTMRLEYGRFSALLPGDLEEAGEAQVSARATGLHSLLLKVAHHGSRNTTQDPFLDRIRPRWAVISAGRNNPFQNPSRETLGRLLRHGARLLLTMDQGAVFLETDGSSYTLSSYALGILEKGNL